MPSLTRLARVAILAISMVPCAAVLARADEAVVYPPMKFTHVRADHPGCRPHCAEWIAAEGRIEEGTAQDFARAIAELGDRRLPIFVNSPGGSVADALAMGRLIRAKHLSVAVAHTEIAPCEPARPVKGAKPSAPNASDCAIPAGAAVAADAFCASACPLVLAGGVERYVSPLGRVGVHQITMFVTRTSLTRTYRLSYRVVDGRKEEVSRDLAGEQRQETTSKESATPKLESEVAIYLRDMGVAGPIMKLMEATPATTLHWLSADEIKDSNMATIWIDGRSGVDHLGANGLAGAPVSAFSGHRALLVSRGDALLGEAGDKPALNLRVEFDYRRGGGMVAASFSTRDPQGSADDPAVAAGFQIDWSAPDASTLVRKSTPTPELVVEIPVTDFCKLMLNGKLEASRLNSARAPTSIDLRGWLGLRPLLDEACPQSVARKAARV